MGITEAQYEVGERRGQGREFVAVFVAKGEVGERGR